MQPDSITRGFALIAALLALAGSAAGAPATWRDAPAHVPLFTPAAHREHYSVSTTSTSIDAVLAEAAADSAVVREEGAWVARRESALDAFGRSGSYNRWQLSQLYGAMQPRVARGARLGVDGRVEAWLLVSPYPSSDLAHLEPGTLRVILRIAP